jgi:CRISPR-associated endoribonuclease Cas6
MRFKINIQPLQPNSLLPFNYQYELSSWIYKLINQGNPEFSDFLHSKGYCDKNKAFKLFCFSNLKPEKFSIEKRGIRINSDTIDLIVSFYPIEAIEPFVMGLFKNQDFILGNRTQQISLKVKTIEKIQEPVFSETMKFELISPLHLTRVNPFDENKTDHLDPEHKDFEEIFFNNLISKYKSYNKNIDFNIQECKFRLLNNPKSKLITIKNNTLQQTELKAYFFKFEITAPLPLVKIGYYAGFGKSNSMGFGCTVIV